MPRKELTVEKRNGKLYFVRGKPSDRVSREHREAELEHHIDELQRQLNGLKGLAQDQQTIRNELKKLQAQLENERQAHVKTQTDKKKEQQTLSTKLAAEQKAHKATQEKCEEWKQLREKDKDILKSKLADAQTGYEGKLKASQAQWERQKATLETELRDARHEALELKTSLQSLTADHHNLEQTLNMAHEANSDAVNIKDDLEATCLKLQEAHLVQKAQVNYYRQSLDEAVSARTQALQQLDQVKDELQSCKNSNTEAAAQAKEAYQDVCLRNNELCSEAAALRRENEELMNDLEEVTCERNDLSVRILDTCDDTFAADSELRQEIAALKQERQDLRRDLEKVSGQRDDLNSKLRRTGQGAVSTATTTNHHEVEATHSGTLWERILKDGLEFIGDTWVYFSAQPLKLIWVTILWWAVVLLG
ncbi:hypothetical protein QBC40DRAFT_255773 [Triangularia verruculosa]|uniref:Uncharacterized protein n=1 Tax=Triangularia verruculosa TaxID=2587418 RepID=A0AAN7ATQ5_9PEZI|nr:hypothetical protein QBC40DRAFT_255773 [Triangularia verruculosa]